MHKVNWRSVTKSCCNQELNIRTSRKSPIYHHTSNRAGGWEVGSPHVIGFAAENCTFYFIYPHLPYCTCPITCKLRIFRKEVICCLIHYAQPTENTQLSSHVAKRLQKIYTAACMSWLVFLFPDDLSSTFCLQVK